MRLELAPIGLQRVVNEMTLHPRPASLRLVIAVETDHPLIQLFTRLTRHHAHKALTHRITPERRILFQPDRRTSTERESWLWQRLFASEANNRGVIQPSRALQAAQRF